MITAVPDAAALDATALDAAVPNAAAPDAAVLDATALWNNNRSLIDKRVTGITCHAGFARCQAPPISRALFQDCFPQTVFPDRRSQIDISQHS
ncbi:hypothetical protein AB4089_12230 [Arthrobacter sp. 2MCAF15]|uniref:hypothetical protein n=1 Tax=Arthrobacter sp. 2MCAF15 TaxID=3232984 RepID=UPI003F921E7A